MTAYYNELDPYAAQWLRNLIAAGHIADGVVDERSIEDVRPSDLKGFTQCHFFAGIGVWSYALRNAGWPDDRPVWTGSCPCQPFSSAGAGAGFADERHLWPAFFHLIEQCKPAVVFGEQVASKDANPWIDLVQTDLEAVGYGVGAVAFPAASVGAPHIRDRLYWAAYASGERVRAEGLAAPGATAQGMCGTDGQRERLWIDAGASSTNCADRMADSKSTGKLRVIREAGGESAVELRSQQERVKYDCGGWLGGMGHAGYDHDAGQEPTSGAGQPQADRPADQPGGSGVSPSGLDDPKSERPGFFNPENVGTTDAQINLPTDTGDCQSDQSPWERLADSSTSPTNGFWRDADWLLCRDGKWRPVEPGTFPLVNGAASRVGRLRAYGNAICASQAQIFIEAAMSHQP